MAALYSRRPRGERTVVRAIGDAGTDLGFFGIVGHGVPAAAGRLRQSAFPLTISEDRGAQRERRNSVNVFEPCESWDNYTNAAVSVPRTGPAYIFWGTLCHLIL